MRVADLVKKCSELKFVQSFSGQDQENIEIETLSSFDEIYENSLVFIKDPKILKKFLALKMDPKVCKNSIAAIPEGSSEFQKTLKDYFGGIMTFKEFAPAIHIASKVFFEERWRQLNNLVDGRQMGTAKVHPTANIAQNVFIGQDVEIGENVVIYSGVTIMGPSRIGDSTTLYPNVTIYPDTVIGKETVVHGNSTIGSDGFGYEFYNGRHLKIYHLAGVEIGDNVELGSGTFIDKGTFKPTRIGNGSKIDNLVQIAHNNQVGQHVVICGQAGTAGSATIEDYVVVGGRAAIAPGVTIGKGAQLAGAAMCTGNAEPGAVLAGHPARPLKEWLRSVATLRKLTLEKSRKE